MSGRSDDRDARRHRGDGIRSGPDDVQSVSYAGWTARPARRVAGREYGRVEYSGPPGLRSAFRRGQGIVEGNEIPYLPLALARRQENFRNRFTDDPESKCFMVGTPRINYMPSPAVTGSGQAQTPNQGAANALRVADLHRRVAGRDIRPYLNSKHHPPKLGRFSGSWATHEDEWDRRLCSWRLRGARSTSRISFTDDLESKCFMATPHSDDMPHARDRADAESGDDALPVRITVCATSI